MRQKWNNRSDRSYMMKIYAIYVSCVEPFRLTLPQASPLLMSCNLKSCQQLLILSYWSTRNRGIHKAQWLSMLSILNIFFYPCILYVCVLMGCFFLNGALGSEIQFCFIQSWWRTHISCPCFFWIFLLFTLLTWCIFQSEYTTCILKNCHYIWNITYKVFTKKDLVCHA